MEAAARKLKRKQISNLSGTLNYGKVTMLSFYFVIITQQNPTDIYYDNVLMSV